VNVEVAQRTELSPRRTATADAVHIDRARGWFVLASGLGWLDEQMDAGRIAVESAASQLAAQAHLDEEALATVVHAIHDVLAAPTVVVRHKRKRKVQRDLTAMLDAVVLVDGSALIAHVGNNRVYRIRGDEARCLTTDHTVAQEMAGPHVPVPRDALYRKVLTSCIGGSGPSALQIQRIAMEPGDTLLICTSGVYDGVVDDAELARAVASGLDSMVETLVERNVADNIASIVIGIR
jgi:PPM family protein phosphatase